MQPSRRLFELPWWSFLFVSLVAFVFLRYGLPGLMLNNSSPFSAGLSDILGRLAWFASAPWVLVAILLFFRQRHRKELLERQKDIQSIREWGHRPGSEARHGNLAGPVQTLVSLQGGGP